MQKQEDLCKQNKKYMLNIEMIQNDLKTSDNDKKIKHYFNEQVLKFSKIP